MIISTYNHQCKTSFLLYLIKLDDCTQSVYDSSALEWIVRLRLFLYLWQRRDHPPLCFTHFMLQVAKIISQERKKNSLTSLPFLCHATCFCPSESVCVHKFVQPPWACVCRRQARWLAISHWRIHLNMLIDGNIFWLTSDPKPQRKKVDISVEMLLILMSFEIDCYCQPS